MKSSLKKLRGFALQGHHKERKEHRVAADQDEVAKATQDMRDMRDCYDSLLSAAAATANCAYEFSEALRDLGSCLLEKTALNDDEESGAVLLKLGKVQFELQKLLDSYRTHIIQTIATPSESLLKELETVEDMKRQCDDSRNLYKFMLSAQKQRGRSRHAKGESFSSQELQEAQEAYDEEATFFIFRLKSLKQGQSRSLLTQAARHHAAQLNFFRKGVKSLEVLEPHVKLVAEQQHIDYHFSGLEDDNAEDDDDYSFDDNDDGELSFDYGQTNLIGEVARSRRNSMELDQLDHTPAPTSATETQQENLRKDQADFISFSIGPKIASKSAPIFADKFEPSEKFKAMRPSSTRKFHTYALPTPIDAKSSNLTGLGRPVSSAQLERKVGRSTQLWHSSPLDPEMYTKGFTDDEPSSPTRKSNTRTVLRESTIKSGPLRVPPPLSEGLPLPDSYLGAGAKKIKRQAYSGPLISKARSGKPMLSATDSIPSVEYPTVVGGIPAWKPTHQPSVSPQVSPSASPPLMSSPKISELHELPRPPQSSARPSSLIGHSAPLISRSQELHATSKKPFIASLTASPLPAPPGPMARSYSIPSSGQGTPVLTVHKLLEAPHNSDATEDVASPPLTPLSLRIYQISTTSGLVPEATKTEGFS